MTEFYDLDKSPQVLYLQWHGDSHPDEIGDVNEIEVTWSRDEVFQRDLKYIRADLVRAAMPDNLDELAEDDPEVYRLGELAGMVRSSNEANK